MKNLFKILVCTFLSISLGQEIEWIQSYGSNDNEYGESGQKTSDGGYIVVGQTDSNSQEYNDVLLIKVDFNGNQEWIKTFSFGSDDNGYSVQQTVDGGYILTGNVWNQGTFLLKTDSNGNEEWSHMFNEDEYGEIGNSVLQTLDGGYMIIGNSGSFSNPYMFLIKTNSNGDEEWVKYFGIDDNELGLFLFDYSIQQTLDGGYIVLTTRDTTGGLGNYGQDVYLLKLDSRGNEQWNKIFGSDGQDERGSSIQQTNDNGFIFTGREDSSVLLVKTDESGNEIWSRNYDNLNFVWGKHVQQTEDGGYILTGMGSSSYDLVILKTDSNGYEEWSITYDYEGTDGVLWGEVIQSSYNGDYMVIGTEWMLFGDRDVVLVKIDSDGNLDNFSTELNSYSLNQPYPNPFNPTTSISFSVPNYDFVSIKVYDINGGLISTLVEDYFNQGTHSLTWDGNGFSSGQYLIKMESGSFIKTQIVSLIK